MVPAEGKALPGKARGTAIAALGRPQQVQLRWTQLSKSQFQTFRSQGLDALYQGTTSVGP